MNKHLEKYICNHYQELLNISKKLTKNSDWAGDLLQNVIIQLYDKKEINLKSIDDNNIKYYIVKCLTVNWYSTTSPFYRKERRESSLYSELHPDINYPDMDNTTQEHEIMDIMEMEWSDQSWFNKIIFTKYLTLGSLKKVSIDTTIPLTSIKRYIDNTKDTIKQNTFKKFNR